jgi:hypothetical protein
MKNLFLLGALLIPTIVYSANDLERWNSEVGRTVRQTHSDKLAQTTYSEISSRNVTVSQDMKTVHPQIETSAQVAGSKTRVVAEAKLVVDKDKVWRDWNKKLNKWGPKLGAGAAALQIGGLILDAVDWVMDPENNTIQKPNPEVETETTVQPYHQYRYLIIDTNQYVASVQALQKIVDAHYTSSTWTNCSVGSDSLVRCDVKNDSSGSTANIPAGIREPNPTYNPNATNPNQPYVGVTESEKEQVLKNLLNDPKYADLAAQMIGNTYSIGPDNPDPDPNVVNDIKDAQKGTLKSDDPKGDGRTRTDPKIDTGTQGQADTTPKPDTGTGTNPDPGTGTPTPNPNPNNGSTTTFELPAFCNYAAKLCDWMDWTQEDKETEKPEEEEPEEFDIGTIDKNRFSANGQCPAPIQIDESVKALGRNVNFDFAIEWTQVCNVAEDSSPLVLLISTITGLLILVGGGRNSEP